MSAGRFNLSALAVRERAITVFLLLLISAAGVLSFFKLGRAEDPAFTIKVMTIVTAWPGATAQEMQDQVAEKIEKRMQELRWYDRTETYTPGHTFLGAVVGPPQMTADTARAAYDEAGLGPEDVQLVHVHDAFAIEELEYYELLGFCRPGEAERMVEDGETEIGGRVAFSTDGGLIARGHPGGPTGLAQIHETVLQLRGAAGPRTPLSILPLLAAAAFASGCGMRVLDPLLPLVAADLGVTVAATAALVSGFAVTYGLGQVLVGPLGDRFGKLRVLSAATSGKNSLDIAGLLKIKGSEIQQRYSELMMLAGGPFSLPLIREAMHAGWQGDFPGGNPMLAPLASTYFNMRKTTIYGGSNEVQRNIVAQTVLG